MAEKWEVDYVKPTGIEGKTIQDFIYFEGMYNPVLNFAFTNVMNVEFASMWNGKVYKVKPHETVKLPHYLAVKFTKEIVDRQMQEKKEGMMLAVPAARKPYEDKVLAILGLEKDATQLEVLKDKFVEQVNWDANRKPNDTDEKSQTEFPNLKEEVDDISPKTFGKVGRPKKVQEV